MKDKNICIFGGAGFVGQNLTEIVSTFNNVTIIDIIEKPNWVSAQKIGYIDISKTSYSSIDPSVFDYLFLLAGNASVSKSVLNPKYDIESNTLSLLNLLSNSDFSKTKVVFFSSAAVYGEMKRESQLSPISPYGISKLCAENYLKYYHKNYGIPVLICRFFSIFGKYNNKQVIFDLTKKIKEKQEQIVVVNPDNKRDFIHIEEAINMLQFICEKSEFKGESYDIGSGNSLSIIQLYEKISKLLGVRQIVTSQIENYIGDPKVQISDIGSILRRGYVFNDDFDSYLQETVEWIINNG